MVRRMQDLSDLDPAEEAAPSAYDLTVYDDEAERVAHLLRRTTFGPFPGQVAALTDLGYEQVVAEVLGQAGAPSPDPDDPDDRDPASDAATNWTGIFDAPVLDVPATDDDADDTDLIRWWIDRMRTPGGGLHEKMVWFWHNHFTSSVDKAPTLALRNQHEMVRRHALGNFRDLARDMVVDAAMLLYLDANGSQGSNPNENLAREMMELFTIGRGNYTQDDVRAAAKALSGWWVDWENAEAGYAEEAGYAGALEFLGTRGRFDSTDIVDLLCDHPACAPFIATELHHYLVGGEPDPAVISELADRFVAEDLEIAPLVAAIVESDAFASSRHSRPRFSMEWFCAASSALGVGEITPDHVWMVETLDQLPFHPPNVAGWDLGERWLSPSLMVAKSNVVFSLLDGSEFGFDEAEPAVDALRRCGVGSVSGPTAEALDAAYWAPFGTEEVNQLLMHLVLTSPEFGLA